MTDSPRKVVVVGAGTMGRGIAIAAVSAGFDTTLVDVSEATLLSARDAVLKEVGKRTPDRDTAALFHTAQDVADAVAVADIVVEAVPEVVELKKDVLGRIGMHAAPGTLVASNTSTMSITLLAAAYAHPDRVIGMHFFNPANRMPLVEIIVGSETADVTVGDAVDFAVSLGKDPIVVRDVPGFVTSRLGLLLGNEAMRIVEEGVASASDVDKAMKLGYRHPMGPLELADLVGLDARLNNVKSMYAQSGNEQYRPPAILERLVRDGRLGRKTGSGFYRYDDDGIIIGPAELPQ